MGINMGIFEIRVFLNCSSVALVIMFKLVLASFLVASAIADVSLYVKPHGKLIKPTIGLSAPRLSLNHIPAPVIKSSPGQHIDILRSDIDQGPDGSYQWSYETANGIAAQEQASVRQLGPKEIAKSAQGSYAFTSPEGEQVSISYIADENGYQPTGSHIPTPPPIPAAIQRALEWIAAHPQPEVVAKRY